MSGFESIHRQDVAAALIAAIDYTVLGQCQWLFGTAQFGWAARAILFPFAVALIGLDRVWKAATA